MDAERARRVDAMLRRLEVPGVVAPVDPAGTSGEWRVYGSADPEQRRDTTADALAAVALGPGASPQRAHQRVRGVVRRRRDAPFPSGGKARHAAGESAY